MELEEDSSDFEEDEDGVDSLDTVGPEHPVLGRMR
jgi:hypothetical protein